MNRDQFIDALIKQLPDKTRLERFLDSPSGKLLETGVTGCHAVVRELFATYSENNARVFLLGLHGELMSIHILWPLGLRRQVLASLRGMIDCALAFSYYAHHLREYRTLVQVPGHYVGKQEILQYHRDHTFRTCRAPIEFGVLSNLDAIYSTLSQHLHSQTPAVMILAENPMAVFSRAPDEAQTEKLVEEASEAVKHFLLAAFAEEFKAFGPAAKRLLVRQCDGKFLRAIGVDP